MSTVNSSKLTSPVIHKTRTQAVIDTLREKILAGEFQGGEALRQSALELMMDEDLHKAEEILLDLENMLETETEIHNWSELNCRFHMTLYRPANRPETLAMIQALHTKSDRYIRLQLLLSGNIPKAESEHRVILQLCRDRNTQDAIESLHKHIIGACADIKTFLASQHKN